MNSKKIAAFLLFSFFFTSLLLPADWHEVVKRHLGTFLVYDRLVVELSARFKNIAEEDKGAAALILAYSFEQIKKKTLVSTPIANFYDKAAALDRKEVSIWLKRYFEEFESKDDDLLFLAPDREAVRKEALTFREKAKKKFPLVRVKTDILELESFIKIKLRINSSVNCGYEIYGEDSALLAEGILKKGSSERIVQVKKKFAGEDNSFIKLLVFNTYTNEQTIILQNPAATTISAPKKQKIYKSKGKYMLPNLIIGTSFFLLNSQLINRLYNSNAVQPEGKAYLDASGKILDTLTFALITKGLIDLCIKKGFCETGNHTQKTIFGFFWSPFAEHNYYVYGKGKREPAVQAGTNFFEQDLSFSILFKKGVEVNLFYRKFKADNVSIAGGLWSTSKSLAGITLGKVLTLTDPDYKFPLDFSGGVFAAANYNQNYTFTGFEKNNNVVSESKNMTYGLYTAIQLRLNILRRVTRPEMPIITMGFKWFFPFNDFEYSGDPEAVYRLHRKFFYIGFYFR